jgi:hypothetical protein
MTKQQLELIVGMIAGLELAIVHVCRVLESKGVAADLAPSFLATADALAPNVRNREQIAMVLRHIAGGLRSADAPSGFGEELRKLLN